ncbi:hypothetical protein [Candidatus Enterococcus huntleyi]|uniref:hypothetical protein n=1 Tax=Candidatus Enterococcus huntleyi TaxID=1857217 RepID=UPI001379ECC8|nr:hypothetical protein [Enterococcus sp. JM4C]
MSVAFSIGANEIPKENSPDLVSKEGLFVEKMRAGKFKKASKIIQKNSKENTCKLIRK